ncbi:hypothetical protein M9458_057600, partial [Cirrhinus mrigala]
LPSTMAPPIVTSLYCLVFPLDFVLCSSPGSPSSTEASSHIDSVFLPVHPFCLFLFLFTA